MINRNLSALVALGILVSAADGQVWTRQSPFPTDRTATSVFALSPQRAIFTGDNLQIVETATAGESWTVRSLGDYGASPYYAVAFATPQVGVIVGNNHDALRTTDGGATWEPISMFAGSWYHLDFVSPSVGFAGANGACASTSNGGATWQLRAGYPSCPVMYGMDFRDANVGLLGGQRVGTTEMGIFKSTDGGRNWSLKASGAANDVLWLSESRAIADDGMLIRESLDEGETWHMIAGGITTGVVSLTRAGASSVVVGVSGKGDVWRSPDAGYTWTQTFDGPGSLPGIWEVHFADALHGWIVGPGGFYYYTADGGLTWTQKNSGCGTQIWDLQMLDESFGMGVGLNGYVFRTTNAGDFWEVQKLEVTGQVWGREEDLVAIDVVDSEFAVAAGPGGTVFKTTDGGVSWSNIGYPNLPGLFMIYDVDFVDRSLGYLYGVDEDLGHTKTLYRTRDGGATWEWVYLGERGGGTTAQFVDSQTGWLTADNTFGLRTVDGGETWQGFNMPEYGIGEEISKVRFLDRNIGWAAGWWGYLARTMDGGVTWTLIDMETSEDCFFDVIPVSANEVWVCGREYSTYKGFVAHSTDGGVTWTRENVDNIYQFWPYRLTVLPTGDAWFGGYAGAIFRRRAPAEEILPQSYTLVRGRLAGGNLQSVLQSDDDRLRLHPGLVLSTDQEPVVVDFVGSAGTGPIASLKLLIETAASSSSIRVQVQLYDYDAMEFVSLHAGPSSLTDQTVTIDRPDGDRFVSPSGEVKCRVAYKLLGPVASFPWETRLDWVRWRATR